MNEWDEVSNYAEENEAQVGVTANDSSFGTIDSRSGSYFGWDTGSYNNIISTEEIVRVSAENNFECHRHGRVQSFRLFANGYGGVRPPREVNTCLHCFMDMLVRNCESEDSNSGRSVEEYRRHAKRMMAMGASPNREI